MPSQVSEPTLTPIVEKKNELPLEIRTVLKAHVVDITPQKVGRAELLKNFTGAHIGTMETTVQRTDPSIHITSFIVEKGKSYALIGQNGAGKSTLFDALMERGADCDTSNGRGALSYGSSVHAREKLRIARLDQEELLGPIEEYLAGDVLGYISDYCKRSLPVNWEDPDAYDRSMLNQDAHTRIEILMSQLTSFFSMDDFLGTKVKHLSGGERTKLSLFMILLSEPDVLLLDEPTNHLDLESITKLTALFEEYTKAEVSIVSISHVDWFLEAAGEGGVKEIVWNKKNREAHESNAPYRTYRRDPNREVIPIINGDIEWEQKDYGYKQGETLISGAQGFTVPESPLFRVTFPTINGGDFLMLSGANGSGKTKLMELCVKNSKGEFPRRDKGVLMAYLPQFWPERIQQGTLGEFFDWIQEKTNPHSQGSAVHKDQPARNYFLKKARDLAFGGSAKMGETWLKRPLGKFSGGEQRLLWFLIVSCLRDVDLLILDEPTNHMDQDLQKKIAKAIQAFPGAVLLSTHDRNLMREYSKDAGTLHGQVRKLKHYVLEKEDGKTHISQTDESPDEYMKRIMKEAQRSAKRLKL